ncbi:MAG: hypothetical protein WCB75_05050, partial [Pseudolabrys sp.]
GLRIGEVCKNSRRHPGDDMVALACHDRCFLPIPGPRLGLRPFHSAMVGPSGGNGKLAAFCANPSGAVDQEKHTG